MPRWFDATIYTPEEIKRTLVFTYEKLSGRDICIAFDRSRSMRKESVRFVLNRKQAEKLYEQLGAALNK